MYAIQINILFDHLFSYCQNNIEILLIIISNPLQQYKFNKYQKNINFGAIHTESRIYYTQKEHGYR